MFHRLAFWKSLGMQPSVIYDIGANVGHWAKAMRSVFPTARIEEFEANPQHRRPGLHLVLLGDTEKEVPFYTSPSDADNTGASIFVETTRHYAPGQAICTPLQMVPLDTYVATHGLPAPEFLKLDVQGAELTVLDGAQTCLQTATYVLLELSLHRWNKGSPMIEEVIRYMDERGYQMVDILDTHFYANFLIQIDVLFAHASTGMRREDFVGQ